jgi:hypothetical protein
MATLTPVAYEARWNAGAPVPAGDGSVIEYWQIPAGSAADTATITPRRGRFIVSVIGLPSNVSANGSTSVVVTLPANSAVPQLIETRVMP